MRVLTVFSSLTLGAALLAGGFVLAGENRSSPPASGERQWLSIGQVNNKIEAAGYRNIEKIEREHGVYEARATDRSGLRVKLYINPQSGEISERTGSEQRHESRSRDRDRNGAASTDCNQRRCRDDRPAGPTATPPAAR
jgi:hypothetical protein